MGQLRFMCVLIASFSILMLSGVLAGLLGIYGYPSEYVVILAYLIAVIVVMSGLYYRLQNMGKGNIGCILIPITSANWRTEGKESPTDSWAVAIPTTI